MKRRIPLYLILLILQFGCAPKQQLVQYKSSTKTVYSSNTEPNKIDSIVSTLNKVITLL